MGAGSGDTVIYHNPKCSTSRKTLDLLQDLPQPWHAFKLVCTRGLVSVAVRSTMRSLSELWSIPHSSKRRRCEWTSRPRGDLRAARRSETVTAPLTGLSKRMVTSNRLG